MSTPYTAAPNPWDQPTPEQHAAASKPAGYITVPPHVLRTLVSAIAVRRTRTDRAAGILKAAILRAAGAQEPAP